MTTDNTTPETPTTPQPSTQPNTSGAEIHGDARARQMQFNPQPTRQVSSSQGVLATAKTPHGGTIANRDVADTDVVEVNGITMPAATAAQHGFLSKDTNGRYLDVSADEAAAALDDGRKADEERQKAEEDADLQEFGIAVDPGTETFLTEATQAVESVGGNPLAALSEWIAAPEKLPAALQMVAEQQGKDPVDVLSSIQGAYDRMGDAVADFLDSKGAVPRSEVEDFFDWCRENKMLELRQAGLSLPYTGDARPYLKLAQDWRAANPGTGPETTATVTHGPGRVSEYVDTKIGKVEKQTAIRLGLVKR